MFTSLSLHLAVAQSDYYSLKLLAVQEENGTYHGTSADLLLEVRDGTGRVFLDTFPLTKMDTQISTRYAKEIACNHFHLNCEKYDFIYTIQASTSIIGGPSAGAAIAALTSVALLDLDYNKNIAITGTINSGGIIGPVGGVKQKLEAASDIGLSKVMIAKGTALQSDENSDKLGGLENSTINKINLIDYGKDNLSLEVVEVMDLDDAVYQLTGKRLTAENVSISENEDYLQIMQGVAGKLCQRSAELNQEIIDARITLNSSQKDPILSKISSAKNSTASEDYYSAASYCLSANILLKQTFYEENKASISSISVAFAQLEKKIQNLREKIAEEKITTISDLQTSAIVKERLNDAQEQVRIYQEGNLTLNQQYSLLAYAEERYNTAVVWLDFFAMDGKRFNFNQQLLSQSCEQKILESEERAEYANLALGDYGIAAIKEKIARAKSAQNKEEYELCLIKASQAKADASAIMSSIGLSDETLPDYIDAKSKAVRNIIQKNSQEGMFPILGYSYYEYAQSLREDPEQKYTVLVYLEYALEMSELSIYFPENEQNIFRQRIILSKDFSLLLEGFMSGVLVTLLFIYLGKKRKKLSPPLSKKQTKSL